jgi:hypothetical protein
MGSRFGVLLGLATLTLSVPAQTASRAGENAEVSVRGVEFQRVRDGGGAEWWEAAVVLEVDPRSGETGRYADRVQVAFNVAFRRPIDGNPFEFYRAAITAPTLEAGRRVFRFYLPPMIVRRDRIAGTARFWTVDLSVDGRAVQPVAGQVSPDFSSAAAVANFREQHARLAPANDGILIPRHQSPWAANRSDPDPAVQQLPVAVERR